MRDEKYEQRDVDRISLIKINLSVMIIVAIVLAAMAGFYWRFEHGHRKDPPAPPQNFSLEESPR